MNIGKAIYGILSGTTAVTDLVSTKIFPEIAEQETAAPFVIYQVQSVQPEDTHDGPSKLDEVRVEVLCYDDAYNGAADLASAVRGALDRVKGTYNGVNVESVQFNDVDFEIEYDPRRYSQVLTFTFRIKRDDIEIALGTPITGAQLGDLSDVDVTGVTDNQILSYDAATGNWIPAADAGGPDILDDLSDVDVGEPAENQMIAYQQGTWSAIYQDEITLPIASVTGLQAALDAAPDSLRELTDTAISGLTDGDYLQYDSASGKWQNSSLILGRNGEQYTGNYDTEAGTLRSGGTETIELYYTAQADGDGLSESAQSDTPSAGNVIRRKLWYAEKAQADPDTSADWTQFADIADDTAYATAKSTLLAYLKARTGGTVPISLKMTWEDVAANSLLLDTYSGAAAAYSLRLLDSTYTGDAIEVYNGSSYADIGFSNGELDTTALATHCGSNDGFVSKWYDQSGNGNTATQTTTANMPKIYDGTTGVQTENGKPIINLRAGNSCTLLLSTTLTNSTTHVFGVAELDSTNNKVMIGILNGAGFYIANNNDTSNAGIGQSLYINGASSSFTTRDEISDQFQNQTSFNSRLNLSSADQTRFGMLNISGDNYKMFNMQEIIFYESDQSSNRTGIEDNINTFYSIY